MVKNKSNTYTHRNNFGESVVDYANHTYTDSDGIKFSLTESCYKCGESNMAYMDSVGGINVPKCSECGAIGGRSNHSVSVDSKKLPEWSPDTDPVFKSFRSRDM